MMMDGAEFHDIFFNTAWKNPWGSCPNPPPPPARGLPVVVLALGPFQVSVFLLNFCLLFPMPCRKRGKKRRGKRRHGWSAEAVA